MDKKEKNLFEKQMKKLEEIVRNIEDGELSLEETIELFKKGIDISKELKKELENAENEINVIVEKNGIISEKEKNIEES